MQNTAKYKNAFNKEHGARRKRALCSADKARLTTCIAIISVLTACFMLVLSGFGFFDITTVYADDAKSESNTVKKAGVFGFEGYHMKDENGNLTGYGIEFLNLVSEYSHLNFQYTAYDKSWDDMLTMLKKGEIDVVTSASKTAAREKWFSYSQPIGRRRTVLSIQVDNEERIRGNYSTYEGMKVGVVKGSSQNKSLEDFAAGKFDYATIETVEFDDANLLAAALQDGDIDAILSSNLRKATNEKELDIIEEADFYAIVRKYVPTENEGEYNEDEQFDESVPRVDDEESKDLLKELNYAIGQMDINEGDWENELFYKYYGPVYNSALFTDREKAFLNEVISGQKTITVTAFGDRVPYSYTENGELKGILPDYFAKLLEFAASEMKVETLPYTLVAPEDAADYNRLAAGGVDVVLDSTSSDVIKEDEIVRGFNTISYMTARMARVIRLDQTGDIKTVAVSESQGKSLIEQAFSQFPNSFEIKPLYSSGVKALQAVLNREADVAYVYSYTAQYYINHGHTDSLYYSSVNGMITQISMHVSENTDHEMVTILNKCIKKMSDDTLNQLVLKYTSSSLGEVSFWEYLKEHPGIIVGIVVAVGMGVVGIIALYLRGHWNKKLLRATEESNKKMSEQLAIVEALSRDYTNVYAIDEEKATARIVKLEGYVTDGLEKDSAEEYDYADILEKYIRGRVHPDDRDELAQALTLDKVKEKLAADNEYSGSYRISEDGKIHNFQYTYLKIANNESGRGGFILVGFRNIDEMIKKEQEQKNVLSEALAQAQYANKAKTTFLNNMSHDIRTPMNAIIGFTSLAVTHIDNKEQIRSYLGKIMTSGNHLLSLINDVLDMSRIESGKVKIEEKETSLPDIMHDLKTIVQADVKSKQLEFYIDTLDVTNETIICDKLRLNQVLLNILSNAMKYTKPGGMVSVRVIQTDAAADGYATYRFSVKDSGIGMSPEFLKHVFEPFEREQTSTVSGIQGTGLGLAITKNIVDMMGGTITVESEVGKGSEFTVTFRFRVADSPVESPRLEQLENLRALVVDDDANTCMSVSKMLSTIGMRPDWTTLGHEAIIRTEFALEQNEPYSAYIIDWLMPDMNGIELVRRIRRIIDDTTPVIILTAYDWSDIEQEAKEAGVTAFCSKPLFLSELKNVLAAPYMDNKVADESEQAEIRFDGMKLLLVEDNELNQEIAQTVLEAAGFEIDTADDGSVAVELMKKKPAGTYDLILMDVQMPIMNGYEATREIRALKSRKKATIPIVAMTANAFEEDRKEAMESGMNGYVPKPIDIAKLMETLKNILK